MFVCDRLFHLVSDQWIGETIHLQHVDDEFAQHHGNETPEDVQRCE